MSYNRCISRLQMCEKQPVSTLLKYILKILPLELRMALFSMLHLFTPELWLNNKLFTNVFCSGSYLIKVESNSVYRGPSCGSVPVWVYLTAVFIATEYWPLQSPLNILATLQEPLPEGITKEMSDSISLPLWHILGSEYMNNKLLAKQEGKMNDFTTSLCTL